MTPERGLRERISASFDKVVPDRELRSQITNCVMRAIDAAPAPTPAPPTERGLLIYPYGGKCKFCGEDVSAYSGHYCKAPAEPAVPELEPLLPQVRELLRRVDEDSRGTRCLTMAEVTLCLEALKSLAAAPRAAGGEREPFVRYGCGCEQTDEVIKPCDRHLAFWRNILMVKPKHQWGCPAWSSGVDSECDCGLAAAEPQVEGGGK